MHVGIIGAGLMGVTTAYALAKRGIAVTVIDRHPEPALETSFANGGQISVCHAEPWASPHMPRVLLKSFGDPEAPLDIPWTRVDPALWAWGLRFLRNCTAQRAKATTTKLVKLGLLSRAVMHEWRAALSLRFDDSHTGILHVYSTPASLTHARQVNDLMRAGGLERNELSPREIAALEPALAHMTDRVAGGFYAPGDSSGDAVLFCKAIAQAAEAAGVTLRMKETVTALIHHHGRVTGVRTDKEDLSFDKIVLAAGSFSLPLARDVGIRLPMVPAKGFSLTLTETDPDHMPRVSITDEAHKIVATPLGARLRVAGTASFRGFDASIDQRRVAAVRRACQTLLPQAGDYDSALVWAGLRPLTPDYKPLLGPTPVEGLWLNTGHGTLGWTLACGAAEALAAVMTGEQAAATLDGFTLEKRH